MKLKAVFEIHGLSNVLTGSRKAEGVAMPGDSYEVDANTGTKHIAEGYAVNPDEPTVADSFNRGPTIIEGEFEKEDAPSLADIAPKIGDSAPAPKKAGKKKAAAAVEETKAEDLDDLGLDDGSDAVE